MAAEDVPPTLRRIARFAPRKRASAAGPLLAALGEPAFRAATAARLPAAGGDGPEDPQEDPLDAAARLWLRRPEGWQDRIDAVLGELAARAAAEVGTTAETAARRHDEAELGRLQRELRRLGERLERAEAAVADSRRAQERATRRAEAAEAALGQARRELAEEREAARRRRSEADAEQRRLRNRLADAEHALAGERGAARRSRAEEDLRIALLVETVVAAGTGLRRELGLPLPDHRPADGVAAGVAGAPSAPPVRARSADDPGYLEELLRLPHAHLVVDGYNVTKSGYGSLTLEQQRERLVGSLAALRVRVGCEVTVVFDGVRSAAAIGSGAGRGVRVRFSAEGETADVLIARLVRAEPEGRPLVVVSSDAEVADSAGAVSARALPSAALLRLLG